VLAAVLAIVLGAAGSDRRKLVAVAAGLAALTIAVFAIPAERARVTGSSPLAAHTSSGRLLLWGETASLVADRPVLGVGPSGYLDSIPAYHSRRYERQVGPSNPPDGPHDWILQAAAAGGIPLALLAVALAALTLIEGVRRVRRSRNEQQALAAGMLAALAGYAVALLFYFTTAGSTPLAALYAGALLAVPASRVRQVRLARMAAAAAFATLTVVLAAAAAAEAPLRSAIIEASAGRLAAADGDFRSAHDLRPWDPGIDQAAAHAFAVLASRGVPGAARRGLPWARSELDAWPYAIGALDDAAMLQAAAGDRTRAQTLLAAALRLDPNNPDLRAEAHNRG
jgi:O-antigen ligase